MKPTFEIDGLRFHTLEEFFNEVSEILIPGADWGRNLDAFNDILRGGFGTPDGGFVLVWKNHEVSWIRLGYAETVRQLGSHLDGCHPTNITYLRTQLAMAQKSEGTTVFDGLDEIIETHGPGGEEAQGDVELVFSDRHPVSVHFPGE
jgi:RNAse (barnase) inhibitor barstar